VPFLRGGRCRLPAFGLKRVLALVWLALGFFERVILSLAVRLPGARRLAHGRVVVYVSVNFQVDIVLLALEALPPQVEEGEESERSKNEYSSCDAASNAYDLGRVEGLLAASGVVTGVAIAGDNVVKCAGDGGQKAGGGGRRSHRAKVLFCCNMM